MGYFTRVFCKSDNRPSINKILNQLNSKGFNPTINLNKDEIKSTNWTSFELYYDENKLPILIECNQIGTEEKLAEEEINEFREFIGKPIFYDFTKKRILSHLDESKYIICNQLPTSDIDELGYEVNGEILKYFRRQI